MQVYLRENFGGTKLEDQKDRFGEKMRLVERAKEDIYYAEKDRELIEKLKARLKKVERPQGQDQQLGCPKCRGNLEGYVFMEFLLARCQSCGGDWLEKGELEGILKKISRGPLASLIDRLLSRREEITHDQPTG
jgi:Zn-finger nucleic acid-binding protein